MRRLLWILLAVLTVALLVLVLQQNETALAELSRFDSASWETKVMAAALVTRGRTVEIARTSSGGFSVAAHVNGARVPMVLDTGASAVVLTQDAAKAAGLPLEVLNYSVNVDTANGRTRAAPVTLDRLSIGDITERSVPALVAQAGQLRTSLLGMTFLNRLESWEVRGDKLMMRGYP